MHELQKELRFAAVCALVLDVLVWVVSLFVCGLGVAVPLGLALGSAGMYCNLLLLRRSILQAVHNRKTRTLGGYLLRCGIASGLRLKQVDALSAVLPFLYPKLIFGILAFHSKKHS